MARDGNAKGMKETKFKDTGLGKIPEEWSVVQVGDLFSMKRNNTLSRDNLNYSDLAGYKNIHYGDVLVKFGAFIDVSTDTLPFVNHDIKFNPDLLENGDVIIADTAEDENVGKASEVIGISAKDKVVSGLHTIVLHPNEKFASKYLGYFLNGEAYHNSLLESKGVFKCLIPFLLPLLRLPICTTSKRFQPLFCTFPRVGRMQATTD